MLVVDHCNRSSEAAVGSVHLLVAVDAGLNRRADELQMLTLQPALPTWVDMSSPPPPAIKTQTASSGCPGATLSTIAEGR